MQYVDLGRLPVVKKNSKKKKFLKLGAIVLLLTFIIYTGYILYWPTLTILKQIAKQPKAVLSLIQNPSGELKKTDNRTNILLIGIDKRSNIPYTYKVGNNEVRKNGFLTDTIIIASLDHKTKKVAMISIPRDLYVKVPSFGKVKPYYTKINAVYSIGNSNDYPTGGAGLLSRVVEEIIGVPVHYSFRVDFEGFRKGVDILGGLDIMVDKTFDDYSYPKEGKENAVCKDGTYNCQVEHIRFEKGMTHMDGDLALKFVRSRKGTNGEGSDFARARRQQKVLLAAKDKIFDVENFADPAKLNNLFREFGQSIETDLDISALVALYNFAKEIDNNIDGLVLDNSEESFLYTPPEEQYGGYVLLPKGGNWDKIRTAVENLLKNGSARKSDSQ